MSDKKSNDDWWFDEELTSEVAETLSTLGRLGVTLVGLPLAMLPRNRRIQARRLADDVIRVGATIPHVVGALFEGTVEERQGESREDLGSRIRRKQRESVKEQRRAARLQRDSAEQPDPKAEPMDDQEEAVEEIEEDIQEAWETRPEEAERNA
jgi:hypothetical protein